jgi:hypothetical protein
VRDGSDECFESTRMACCFDAGNTQSCLAQRNMEIEYSSNKTRHIFSWIMAGEAGPNIKSGKKGGVSFVETMI